MSMIAEIQQKINPAIGSDSNITACISDTVLLLEKVIKIVAGTTVTLCVLEDSDESSTLDIFKDALNELLPDVNGNRNHVTIVVFEEYIQYFNELLDEYFESGDSDLNMVTIVGTKHNINIAYMTNGLLLGDGVGITGDKIKLMWLPAENKLV